MIERGGRKFLEMPTGPDPDVRDILAEEERREAGWRIALGAERLAGQRDLLEGMLRDAFGPLSSETVERLQNARKVHLTRWAIRFRLAKTLDDVFE